MKFHKLLVATAVAGSISLAACGGGGGGAGAPAPVPTTNPTSKPPVTQANAKSSITMRIPLKVAGVKIPSALGRLAGFNKPMFVDGNSNGSVAMYFDGTHILDFSSNSGNVGPGPSGSGSFASGGTYTWASTISDVGNQPVATVTVNYTAVAGSHTIGAVQTNGPCSTVFSPPATAPDPCASFNNGYVLAEGQTTQVLQPGNNNSTALYLRGVMESAYVCDAGCSGQNLTLDTNGYYDLYVVVADENGTAISHQTDANGNVVPFDNGSYTITEQNPTGNGGSGILSIDKPGPFNAPGTDHANAGYGVDIKVKCLHTGTTTLAAQLDGNGGTPSSPVTGFTITPGTNYPTANMVIGSIGADLFYGNQLALNCDASGTLTIQ